MLVVVLLKILLTKRGRSGLNESGVERRVKTWSEKKEVKRDKSAKRTPYFCMSCLTPL